MTEQTATTTTDGLTGGDWALAVVSLFLTPLVSILLSIYNFARSRRSQGLLYLGVLGVQITLIVILSMGR